MLFCVILEIVTNILSKSFLINIVDKCFAELYAQASGLLNDTEGVLTTSF